MFNLIKDFLHTPYVDTLHETLYTANLPLDKIEGIRAIVFPWEVDPQSTFTQRRAPPGDFGRRVYSFLPLPGGGYSFNFLEKIGVLCLTPLAGILRELDEISLCNDEENDNTAWINMVSVALLVAMVVCAPLSLGGWMAKIYGEWNNDQAEIYQEGKNCLVSECREVAPRHLWWKEYFKTVQTGDPLFLRLGLFRVSRAPNTSPPVEGNVYARICRAMSQFVEQACSDETLRQRKEQLHRQFEQWICETLLVPAFNKERRIDVEEWQGALVRQFFTAPIGHEDFIPFTAWTSEGRRGFVTDCRILCEATRHWIEFTEQQHPNYVRYNQCVRALATHTPLPLRE